MAVRHHHHPGGQRKLTERATDLLTIGFVVALGLAMLIGLVTATGQVTW
jgi:hypothetical protein